MIGNGARDTATKLVRMNRRPQTAGSVPLSWVQRRRSRLDCLGLFGYNSCMFIWDAAFTAVNLNSRMNCRHLLIRESHGVLIMG